MVYALSLHVATPGQDPLVTPLQAHTRKPVCMSTLGKGMEAWVAAPVLAFHCEDGVTMG